MGVGARGGYAVTPTLTNPQRWALQLAEAHGWGVQVEAAGARITLRHGRPGYGLVLYVNDAARDADERGHGAAPPRRMNPKDTE